MERSTTRSLLLGTALQTSLAVALALPTQAQPAPNAHPTGGVVIAGSAAISQTANSTAINQSTQRAAVNWQSFNVGSQQSVTFNQPSASAVTLNRVVGPDPSQIAGRIDANGQVVLVNQSGVTFYKGAQVNTNGLVVSAIGMTNGSVQNFINGGQVVLDQPGNPNAAVINNGNITVKQAGLAALVAPQVANRGTITAALGHVVLAGAKTATLDLYGDGLLSLDVSNQVTQAPLDKDGKPVTALVTNTGTIVADGGTVQLTARAADGIVQNLVQAGGKIRANTMADQTGMIALGGVGGSIVVEGQLSAMGSAPGTKGGNIEIVTDKDVVVASTARINASGTAGGGTLAIGTTLARAAGGPSVTPTLVAANTVIQSGAKINARATGNGNGGRVTVLSSKDTSMAGTINAEGGPSGGNGGFVEVSSDMGFSLTGAVDVSAPKGSNGTILLDPLDLTIGAIGTDNGTLGTIEPQMGFNTVPAAASGDAFISNTAVEDLLGNIDLQASQDLTVTAPITLTTPGQSLTLEAGRNLVVALGGAISTAGDITLTASAPAPAPPLTYPGGFSTAGALTLNDTVSTSNGAIRLTAGTGGISVNANVSATTFVSAQSTGGITISAAMTGPDSLHLTAAGPITETPTGSIVTGLFDASTTGAGAGISLTSTTNNITISNGITATDGDVTVVNSQDLTLVGAHSGNNLFFEVHKGGGTLTLSDADPSTDFANPAALTAKGRISLVADNESVIFPRSDSETADSTITAGSPGTPGSVELAPFSSIGVSLLGSAGLVISPNMLSIIQTNGGTLTVGGFTNAPLGATTPVASATSVDISGALDLTGIASTLQLDATGAITESGGPLTVTNLAGSGGVWTLSNNANAISTVGTIVASDFGLNNSLNLGINGTVASSIAAAIDTTGALTVNGEIDAPTIVLTASNITVPGSLIAGTLAFNAGGAFSETGAMNVGTIVGLASGAIDMTGANQIAVINGISASSVSLNDSSNLLISGALEATHIAILDPTNQITLGNNAEIFTGGTVRPPGPIQPALEPVNGAPGAFLRAASFVQVGTSFVFSPSSGPTTLQISTTGNMQFDPPLGLQGTGTWLILNLTNGAAAGNVFVNALDVSYTVPGSAGLSGTIAGISGGPAASVGFILPAINTNYRFNGCVIEATVCNPVLPPTSSTPLPTTTTTTPFPTTTTTTPFPTTTTTQLTNSDITSALGGLYLFLPGSPAPPAGLSNLVLVALPMLPASAPQLTDPDVVPPNISYLDY